ncbi:uncharacterized protein M421DRAFT_90300 [Didymella exigua CBS 183.55]|uniref:Uncharacterized protein n=1 Tax=Didymella exigua CBS 183.55 TaxID=1150837 RepID=A0A6A5RUP8_9PLEO|nr:uncharacterized protein M421DRAFT_90300 [Didymella exigua CBS 183.55]KAF1931213.1 hypothetical protein M421DRAFT_90300 [Didymella exigua CBS 183.55]
MNCHLAEIGSCLILDASENPVTSLRRRKHSGLSYRTAVVRKAPTHVSRDCYRNGANATILFLRKERSDIGGLRWFSHQAQKVAKSSLGNAGFPGLLIGVEHPPTELISPLRLRTERSSGTGNGHLARKRMRYSETNAFARSGPRAYGHK